MASSVFPTAAASQERKVQLLGKELNTQKLEEACSCMLPVMANQSTHMITYAYMI